MGCTAVPAPFVKSERYIARRYSRHWLNSRIFLGDFSYFLITSSMSALSFIRGGVCGSVFGVAILRLVSARNFLIQVKYGSFRCGSAIEGCSSIGLLMPASSCAESMTILYIFPVSLSCRIARTISVTCLMPCTVYGWLSPIPSNSVGQCPTVRGKRQLIPRAPSTARTFGRWYDLICRFERVVVYNGYSKAGRSIEVYAVHTLYFDIFFRLLNFAV